MQRSRVSARGTQVVDHRIDALNSYLETQTRTGYRIESQTASQAIIVRNHWPLFLFSRFRPGMGQTRKVVSVDDVGNVSTIDAEPRRW
jgi:hypothetical protein